MQEHFIQSVFLHLHHRSEQIDLSQDMVDLVNTGRKSLVLSLAFNFDKTCSREMTQRQSIACEYSRPHPHTKFTREERKLCVRVRAAVFASYVSQ